MWYEPRSIDPGFDWDEAVISYNIPKMPVLSAEPFLYVNFPDSHAEPFDMGVWTTNNSAPTRSSYSKRLVQGTVDVDTLTLNARTRKFSFAIKFELTPEQAQSEQGLRPGDSVKFLGAVLTNTNIPLAHIDGHAAPIVPLDVPERCQMDYKDGDQHCSPTSLAMVLAYWAYRLHRPELVRDVPEVIKGVYDQEYKGSGNWSFNVAYAGQFPSIRAYVTRFDNTAELRQWLEKGVPVVCSGSLFLLEGRPRPKHDPGHLFVLVGFDKNGDPIFNDPGRYRVRQTYKLADFEKAWDTSGRTVYLIYPESLEVPEDKLGHWFSG